MKISVKGALFGQSQITSFVLGDSPANIPIRALRINNANLIQQWTPIRADSPVFRDRGNQTNRIGFEVSRVFDELVDADSFVLKHGLLFPKSFTLTMQGGVAGQTGTVIYIIENAVCDSSEIIQMGCTLTISYQLRGGVMVPKN